MMRKILRSLALLSVATSLGACAMWPGQPTAEPEWPEIDIPYQRFVLDNGLTLLVHEDRKAPIVAVNVWYHVGSKNESPGRTGFAHLFEHLMFNGSENYNDEYFRPLEAAGATGMNGTTNADRTNYFANIPSPSLDLLLWLESDRMGNMLGAVDQAKLDEQRGVVQNEKRQGLNRPYGRVWELLPKYTYPEGHPYSWSTIGSMDDLNAATLDDVHEWFKTWYGASNAVVVIAGDIGAEQALAKVEHYFGAIPPGPQLQRPAAWPAPMDGDRKVTVQDQVPQARTYFVWNVAPNYSEDLVHIQLASDVLANGKNSRLYQRLVYDEKLATDVGAYVLARELGSQLILWVTARPDTDIAAQEAILQQELSDFLASGPTQAELQRVKTRLRVGMIRGLERVGGFGGKSDQLASGEVIAGDPAAYKNELRWLDASDPASVTTTLADWLAHGHLQLRVEPHAPGQAAASQVDRSALPQQGEAPTLELPELQRTRLRNGLQVVLAERHAAPVVKMRFMADGGYAADPAGKEGLAALTMDLLDEGAGELSGPDIARELERLGAGIGSSASLDLCEVSLSAISTTLPQALPLYRKVLTQPRFPQDELERLRARQLAGIAQEKADPFQLGLRVLPPILYGEMHPYGVPMTGSGYANSLKTLQRDDVLSFYQRCLRPDNARLLVVGDIAMAALKPLLETHLGDWSVTTPLPERSFPKVARVQQPRIYLLDRPDAPQSVILAGHLTAPIHDPDNLAMTTANTAFGGKFTSRINLNLREDKHWAYGAGSAISTTRHQRPFIVYTRVQSDKTVPAMREMRKEMIAIRGDRPIRAEELASVVQQRTLSLPGRNETAGQISGSIAHILNLGLPDDYYARFVTDLQAMDVATVNAGARKLIQPDALSWIVVGDRQALEDALNDLNWGTVQVLDDE